MDPDGRAWVTSHDLENAGKAFVGAVYGVGEVIAAPGIFTYQATGTFLYGVTGSWQYKSQAEEFARTTDALGEAFQSPEHFVTSIAEGFGAQVERFDAAIERGDPFEAAAGLGNVSGQVLVAGEGLSATASGMPAFGAAVTTEGATVPMVVGSTLAVVRPGLVAGGALAANNANAGNADATIIQENTPSQANTSQSKQVKASGGADGDSATRRRVKPRKKTREEIRARQPRNEQGEMVDPNTQEALDPDWIDTGHKKGQEWRTRKKMHEERRSTRKEVIESENDPDLYQLEDRSQNRSHKHEKKDQ